MIVGNTQNPKALLVFSSMDLEDSQGQYLQGSRYSLVREVVNLEEYAITWVIPEPLYKDSVLKDQVRKASGDEIKKHLPGFFDSLKDLKTNNIIVFGSTLLKEISDGTATSINECVGEVFKKYLHNREYNFVINYDPGMVFKMDKLKGEFKAIIDQVGVATPSEAWVILDYEQTIFELKRILKLYKNKEISYLVFDTETSDFSPHKGELIMYSWAHEADPRGFCVPLKVNNHIPEKTAFEEYQLTPYTLEEGELLSSENWKFPNFYTIPEVKVEIDAHQVQNINTLLKKVLETVPLVGHNLKFDIKWLHYHGVADLRKMKVLDDTSIMGFQIYGKGFSGWLSLKGMCQRLFKAPEWDKPQDDFLSRFRTIDERRFSNIPTGMLGYYACLDAFWNRRLYQYLRRTIKPHMLGITQIITDVIPVFAEAETKGVAVDKEVRTTLETAYTKLSVETEKEIYNLPVVARYRQMDFDRLYAKKEMTLKKAKPNPDKIWEEVLKLKNPAKIQELMYGEEYYGLPHLEDYMTDGGKLNDPKPSSSIDARDHFLQNFLDDKTLASIQEQIDEATFTKLKEARKFLELINQFARVEKLLSNYLGENLEACMEGNIFKSDFNLIGTLGGRFCVTGDTLLPLLDGREVRIDSLPYGSKGWIMGCRTDGQPVPVEFTSLGETKRVKNLIRVTLDNGKTVDTTEDHPYMLRDGSYVQAQDLVPGTSLMPWYRKKSADGYHKVMDNKKRKWIHEHAIVSRYCYPLQFKILKLSPTEFPITHHLDFNKQNNTPENLLPMFHKQHIRFHSTQVSNQWKDEDYTEKMHSILRNNNKKNWENPEYVAKMEQARKHSQNPQTLEKMSKLSKSNWKREEYQKLMSQKRKAMWENEEYRALKTKLNQETMDKFRSDPSFKDSIRKGVTKFFQNPENRRLKKLNAAWHMVQFMGGKEKIPDAETYNRLRKDFATPKTNFGSPAKITQEFYDEAISYNHKIVSIEKLVFDEAVPVYDLSCPETENFSISAGIFIHNSSGFHVLDSWSDIKRLYTSRWKGKGGIICAPDFSQLELRIAACVSGDPSLIKAYKDGIDIHIMTASKIYQVPVDKVDKSMRSNGKCVVAGTLIETDQGLKKIEDIVGEIPNDQETPYTGDLKIATLDGYRSIAQVYRKEDCSITRVELENGKTLETTDNHPYVTSIDQNGKYEIVPADQLSVNQEVYSLKESLNEDEWEIIV